MNKKRNLLDILILSLLWGPSYLLIKMAVNGFDPFTLVFLRTGIAAIIIYVILQFKRITIPKSPKLWAHCFMIGLFNNSIAFICFNISLISIPTSLSALLNGTTPITTIILANLFLADERLNLNKVVGVFCGFLGFIILFAPAVMGTDSDFNTTGMLFSFMGATSYAFGNIYAKKHVQFAPPLVVPLIQLLTSCLCIMPLAFIFEAPIEDIAQAKWPAWCALLSLASFGTAFGFLYYYRIILHQGATAVSMVAYLLPILGTILGVVFLNENLDLTFFIAAAWILFGVMVANNVISLPKLKKRRAV